MNPKLVSERDCLKREIRAGSRGVTRVSRDWLRWARGELRRMNRLLRGCGVAS